MQIVSVLLALAATATAVDIRLYGTEGCNNRNFVQCANYNPHQCCGNAGNLYRSVSFNAIPINWNLNTYAYDGGNCRHEIGHIQSQGRQDVCHSGPPYSGGIYDFAGKKKREAASNGECSNPTDMVYENGKTIDISTLDDASSTRIQELFFAGATAEEVEAEIASLA